MGSMTTIPRPTALVASVSQGAIDAESCPEPYDTCCDWSPRCDHVWCDMCCDWCNDTGLGPSCHHWCYDPCGCGRHDAPALGEPDRAIAGKGADR